MSQAAAKTTGAESLTLAERFWSLAKGKPVEHLHPEDVDPAVVVKHVLAILDSLDQGKRGDALSVNTLSFLKLLRQAELAGELCYASPEQIRGESMDERSLVFSVGVLLFERLTGRHPFGAENNEPRRVARIRRGEFGSGVNYFPTVSAGMRSILMRAMGPFPEERYSTLAEMRANLEDYVNHNRVPPPLPGTTDAKMSNQATRVVDMSKIAQGERAVAHLRPASLRDSDVRSFDEPAIGGGEAPARAMERAQTTVMQRRQAKRVAAPRSTTPVPTDAELFAKPTKPRSRMLPLVYAAGGAAIASVLFFVLGSAGSDKAASSAAPAKASAHAQPVAVTTTEPAPPAAPGVVATNAVPQTDDHKGDTDEAAPSAAVFDPQRGGESILATGRECFSDQRLAKEVRFGLGVVYPTADEKPRKLYFSPASSNELTRGERSCLTRVLAKVTPGALPDKPQLIDYWFKLSTSAKTIRVKTKLAP